MGFVGKLDGMKKKIKSLSGDHTPHPPNLLEALIGVIGEAKHAQEETVRTDEISIQFHTDPVVLYELT